MTFVHRLVWSAVVACLVCPAFADEVAVPVEQAPAVEQAKPEGAAAEEDGQELLNDAINAKLEIDEIDDFGRVLDLCKKAIERGLDEGSTKFANDLYTGTLIDRAAMLTGAIVDADQPDPNWRRIRAFAMRDLNEVVARDPSYGSVHLMMARLEALPGGNRERAKAAATKALELLGDDQLPRAQANLVLAALDDDPEKQLRFYDAAVELAPRATGPAAPASPWKNVSTNAERLARQGRIFNHSGKCGAIDLGRKTKAAPR